MMSGFQIPCQQRKSSSRVSAFQISPPEIRENAVQELVLEYLEDGHKSNPQGQLSFSNWGKWIQDIPRGKQRYETINQADGWINMAISEIEISGFYLFGE